MEINISDLDLSSKYKLLTGLIFPRPIGLVSTISENGVNNCAPFSWFNAICEDPPLIYLSFNTRTDGRIKHTLENILRTKEFIVNLVDESIANGMHLSSHEYPIDVSEFDECGFTSEPGLTVKHPRIKEAPASLECRLFKRVALGPAREFLIGEVIHLHVRDNLVAKDTYRVSETEFWPVGRLHGTKYCSTRERFDLPQKESELKIKTRG